MAQRGNGGQQSVSRRGGWTSESGSTTAWRRTRLKVITEDGNRCRVGDVIAREYLPARITAARSWLYLLRRSPACSGAHGTLTAHHIRGKKVTGDDPRFLIAACLACNLHMGDPSTADPEPRVMTEW